VTVVVAEPVGRAEELSALAQFLDAGSARMLAFVGEPGIGKTTLWEQGVLRASDQGFLTLSTRVAHSDTELPFAGLADLAMAAEAHLPQVMDAVPEPQRRALEAALHRRDVDGTPPEQLALASGTLALLREAAAHAPVLLAIDDLQWLDGPSADCLGYALHRITDSRVRVLTTRHPGPVGTVERAVGRDGVRRVDVGGLGSTELLAMVTARLGWRPTAAVARHFVEVSRGNPLFALELGRQLSRTASALPVGMPVPESVAEVFGPRLSALPDPARQLLLVVALGADLTVTEATALHGAERVEEAIEEGLLAIDGVRLRPAHPLLGATVRAQASPSERRTAHRVLAGIAADPIGRTRHLALAAELPDAKLANEVSAAAATMSTRPGAGYASELAVEALRLTPSDDDAWPSRVLQAARSQLTIGRVDQALSLLRSTLEELPRGRDRALAHLLIGEGASLIEDERSVERALAESDDDEIRAFALSRQAMIAVVGNLRSPGAFRASVGESLEAATRIDNLPAQRRALAMLGWIDLLQGLPVTRTDADEAPVGTQLYEEAIERPYAVRHAFRGELDDADRLLTDLFDQAEQLGQAASMVTCACHLFELAIRRGDVAAAERWLVEFAQLLGSEEPDRIRSRLQADLAVTRGDLDIATEVSLDLLEDPDLSGWDALAVERVLGLAALGSRDPATAALRLGHVWQELLDAGIEEPGVLPVAGDLVEALVESGDLAGARAVVERLAVVAETHDHPWARITVDRAQALVALADGQGSEFEAGLADAAERYGRLGLRFDQARTLLELGRIRRGADRRTAAREALGAAAEVFRELGCLGWAGIADEDARSLSGRRRSRADVLTPAERRVATLAAGGLSNREIAKRLVLSIHTVEAHLSHVYAKLGIQSRAQLIHRL
jgi:DNA-binding CsgD family transcriptional regulator